LRLLQLKIFKVRGEKEKLHRLSNIRKARAIHGAHLEHERTLRELQHIQSERGLAERRNYEVIQSANQSFERLRQLKKSSFMPKSQLVNKKPVYSELRSYLYNPKATTLAPSKSLSTLSSQTQSISILSQPHRQSKRQLKLDINLIDNQFSTSRPSDAFPLSTRSSEASREESFAVKSSYYTTPKTTVSRGSELQRAFTFGEKKLKKEQDFTDVCEAESDEEASDVCEVYGKSTPRLGVQNAPSLEEYELYSPTGAEEKDEINFTVTKSKPVELDMEAVDERNFVRGRFHRSPTFGHAITKQKETFLPVPKTFENSAKATKIVEVTSHPDQIRDLATPDCSDSSSMGFDSSPSMGSPGS